MKRSLVLLSLLAIAWHGMPAFAATQPAPVINPLRSPPPWVFADIRVTVVGPNTVRVEWMPLAGADQYVVYRNGFQIGPSYPSATGATQPVLIYDYAAPANASSSYTVKASGLVTTTGLPNTPNAGKTVTIEGLLQTSNAVAVTTPPLPQFLTGVVDLHTHPLSHLGFGGKLVHGGVDVGSLMPAGGIIINTSNGWSWNTQQQRAASLEQALSNDRCTHGGWGTDNPCGNLVRNGVVRKLQEEVGAGPAIPDNAAGADDFPYWPAWGDVTHQKMYADWIWRAWYYGGLRVIVALAVNNKTLADAVVGDAPTDDARAADLQLAETRNFVARHSDFMEVAYSSADLKRIVANGRLAVVLGVEIDSIGNFKVGSPPSGAQVSAELDRLVGEGVRYIFPVHVIDNVFGGSAVYVPTFNLSNYRETGQFWSLECADPASGIRFHYQDPQAAGVVDVLEQAGVKTALGIDPLRNPPTPPACASSGHQNSRQLTPLGLFALKEMMKRGLILDIDHMDQYAVKSALTLAESVSNGGYPLNSGHNSLRGNAITGANNENNRTADEYMRIARLHGIVGVGSAGLDATQWLNLYRTVTGIMQSAMSGATVPAAFGTDMNGLVLGMKPRVGSSVQYDASFPQSRSGNRAWNYNVDGVAHYGMLADFLRDVRSLPGAGSAAPLTGAQTVDTNLMYGADYFWRMWAQCEAQRTHIPP